MPTRNEQQQIRRRNRLGEPHGESVRFQMMYPNEWQPLRQRQRLAGDRTDDQTADEPRPRRRRNRRQVAKSDTGLGQRIPHK